MLEFTKCHSLWACVTASGPYFQQKSNSEFYKIYCNQSFNSKRHRAQLRVSPSNSAESKNFSFYKYVCQEFIKPLVLVMVVSLLKHLLKVPKGKSLVTTGVSLIPSISHNLHNPLIQYGFFRNNVYLHTQTH